MRGKASFRIILSLLKPSLRTYSSSLNTSLPKIPISFIPYKPFSRPAFRFPVTLRSNSSVSSVNDSSRFFAHDLEKLDLYGKLNKLCIQYRNLKEINDLSSDELITLNQILTRLLPCEIASDKLQTLIRNLCIYKETLVDVHEKISSITHVDERSLSQIMDEARDSHLSRVTCGSSS